MENKIIILGIISVLIIITAIILSSEGLGKNTLPSYATKNEKVKEAYLFAKENKELVDGINCYCGCMEGTSSGRVHKDGLEDCFLKENWQFDSHGSNCKLCLKEILDVKQMLAENKTKEEIKTLIDEKYSKLLDSD